MNMEYIKGQKEKYQLRLHNDIIAINALIPHIESLQSVAEKFAGKVVNKRFFDAVKAMSTDSVRMFGSFFPYQVGAVRVDFRVNHQENYKYYSYQSFYGKEHKELGEIYYREYSLHVRCLTEGRMDANAFVNSEGKGDRGITSYIKSLLERKARLQKAIETVDKDVHDYIELYQDIKEFQDKTDSTFRDYLKLDHVY